MAIGTGGLTGQGLLSGEHIFVPNAWNDFIFAYLANVLGFLGAAAVLLLLFALCLRTLRTGLQCPDALGCNICVGIFAALFLLRRHCAQRRHEHPPQQAGNAADFIKKAGTVRFSLLLSWPPLRGGSARRRWGERTSSLPDV